MAKPYDIVAHTYKADLYCPYCTEGIALKAMGGAFLAYTNPEERLDQWAEEQGINRDREDTFDSDDFPKIVFRDMLDDDEHCGQCHKKLGD
jgi:hypothetical protein